jgi:cystathionine gamma-synthase
MSKTDDLSPETISVHALGETDAATGGLTPAIHTSATFLRDENYELLVPGNSYGRDENPTHRVAEAVLRELEGGEDAMLFSSGMAAAMAVVQALKPGDHIVAPQVMYWGLRKWLLEFGTRWGIDIELFDPSQPDALANSITPGKTKLVWIETPCNPTWDVIDIAAAADLAHKAGALLAVDSTVATPVLTQPLKLGADIIMHSATKYLNGHCDAVAGALVTAKSDAFWERAREVRHHSGAVLGSLEAWLLQRSMRTLFLRVHKASGSALAIAQHFDNHPNLVAVLYPGLSSHPGHDVAARQMNGGFGAMLSIRVKGGAEAALSVAGRCRVFARATSLGGVESLIEHRYTIEGETSPIPKDLLRLSIGIESVGDLIADLEQALA